MVGFVVVVDPPIRGDFVLEIYFILAPQHGLGASSFEYSVLFFGSMLQLFLVSLFSPSSFLEAFRESFILAAPEKLSIYCRLFALISWWTLVQSFFYFFGIFWYFLVFFHVWICLVMHFTIFFP